MTNLLGRQAEIDAIEDLLAGAKAGRSGVLVVRGEAGIGKTALLEHARRSAVNEGFRVELYCGAESESQFAFAGLHQLCAPLLDHARALPEPQQAALGVALGLRAGAAPDRFLVGLATLNLLADVAEEGPLLCILDDAQWLDHASAEVMAFVARRITVDRVVLIVGMRDMAEGLADVFADLEPELRLGGLGESDARVLLAEGFHAPLDEDIRDRVLAESLGNPLALLELPKSVRPTEMAGGFELPDVVSVPRRIENTFHLRSAGLSADAQTLLLLAAADPTGDAALLRRALQQLGADPAAAAEAEASGLLEIDAVVRFRHPLVRSAIYQAATPSARRRAHEALASATDPAVAPDRRAWHRSQAVVGTDEGAAMELEHSAARTRARGGVAAAAAFLQQAAEISPEPAARARRALEAAHAKHDAGAHLAALELADVASEGPLDDLQRARLDLLRARLAFHRTQGREAPGLLLDAAKALAPLDPSLARETYLHALDAAMFLGGLDAERDVTDVAEAARTAPSSPDPPRPLDLLLDGLVTAFTEGFEAAVPALRRALHEFREHGFDGHAVGQMGSLRWLWLAGRTAAGVFDDQNVRVLAERNVRLAREAGALTTLPGALAALSSVLVLLGELPEAAELAAEGAAITTATGAVPQPYGQLFLAAWSGEKAETIRLATVSIQNAGGRGSEYASAHYALAVLHNGQGNYPAAAEAGARACETDEFSNIGVALPEVVEAAVRAGQHELAAAALEELSSRAAASGTAWALGLAERSRALVSTDVTAAGHYRQSIEWLTASGVNGHLARTHLVYGEWLRRQGHRQEARKQLRIAFDALSTMGARAFADRAARELRATGEHPRRGTDRPATTLTAHELQIARLVASGATSREVGAHLFLSPRTIEAHLRSIFRKLEITSRRQLKDLHLP